MRALSAGEGDRLARASTSPWPHTEGCRDTSLMRIKLLLEPYSRTDVVEGNLLHVTIFISDINIKLNVW